MTSEENMVDCSSILIQVENVRRGTGDSEEDCQIYLLMVMIVSTCNARTTGQTNVSRMRYDHHNDG